MNPQLSLGLPLQDFPEGFQYLPDFITVKQEISLLQKIRELEFRDFQMHGVTARRKVIHYGVGYDLNARSATAAEAIPSFLRPYQKKVAQILGVKEAEVAEILVTHYPLGAPIGWHRDAPMFESLFGISLNASATMKLRPLSQDKSQIKKITLDPRSGYLIMGEARWLWQHHIPPQKEERYSITFRTLKSRTLIHDHDI